MNKLAAIVLLTIVVIIAVCGRQPLPPEPTPEPDPVPCDTTIYDVISKVFMNGEIVIVDDDTINIKIAVNDTIKVLGGLFPEDDKPETFTIDLPEFELREGVVEFISKSDDGEGISIKLNVIVKNDTIPR